ncbi:MAG: alginate export family protein [Phycisphaerales bacterium]|nr:alginate export family protein [Phycisphaerales bacterium]
MHRRVSPRATNAAARTLVIALTTVVLATPALAQDAALRERLQRLLDGEERPLVSPIAPGETTAERMYVDLGFTLREVFFNVNNPDSTSMRLWQTQADLYGYVSYAGAHQAYLRLNLDYRTYSPGDVLSDTQGQGQLAEPILAAAWYRFDWAAAQRIAGHAPGSNNARLTLGRQRVSIGAGLVLDDDLDAAVAELTLGSLEASLVGGVTPKHSTIDFDGSRPDFDTSTHRQFLAAQLRWQDNPALQPYFFVLAQLDDNDTKRAILNVGGVAVPTEFGYDSNYLGLGATGSFDESWVWALEGVYEWGTSTSNPFDYTTGDLMPPTRDHINAWAGVGSLTYLFNDEHDSKLHAWVMAGSGDTDRRSGNQTLGGNARNTTDQAFNAFGYVPTGYALAPGLANLLITRIGGSTRLGEAIGPSLRVGADAFLYAKLDADAGATIDTVRGQSFVGGAMDIFAKWHIAPDIELDLRYGMFVPGDAIPDQNDDVHHLVYLGVSYAF